MTYLAENALPIWVGGAVLVTFALVVYAQLRTATALKGVVGAVLVTALLLVASWLIVTPREAVETSLKSLAAAVEANDLPGTLDHIAPGAYLVRSDAETLMPQVTVSKARVMSTPKIELSPPDDPTEAVVRFRAFVELIRKRDGMRGGRMGDLTVTFVREGDRWLVESYEPERDLRGNLGR